MTMKRTADYTLAGIAVLFVLSLGLMRAVGEPVWLLAVQAMLEGAFVGGVADWFAVKALFDAPLGIRFHTRLVPRNRAKLLRAIADGVQNQVLSKRVIRSQVSETMLVKQMLDAVESYGVERVLDKVWYAYVGDASYRMRGASYLLRKADAVKLSDVVRDEMACEVSGRLLAGAMQMAQSRSFGERVRSHLDRLVEEKSGGMMAKLFVFLGTASGAIDTTAAAESIVRAVSRRLQRAFEQEDDELRVWLTQEVCAVVRRLDEGGAVQSMLGCESVRAWLTEMMTAVMQAGEEEAHAVFLREGASCYRVLTSDEKLLVELEAKMRWMVYRFVETRGYLIGEAVERTLDGYSEDEMRDFIEEKVGDNLQWIRINGSVLGGILGLLAFGILYAGGIVLG